MMEKFELFFQRIKGKHNYLTMLKLNLKPKGLKSQVIKSYMNKEAISSIQINRKFKNRKLLLR